ncbi:MAG: SDR family NAD(P)-dependent oxidoreductase [Caldilineaceae bacterium]
MPPDNHQKGFTQQRSRQQSSVDRNRVYRNRALIVAAGLGLGWWARKQWQRNRHPTSELAGQVVLITGASRGLGLQLALEFAAIGCYLVICARDERELERAQRILVQHGADVLTVPCDVTKPEQVEALITTATHHYGKIDILVNNAGIIEVGPLQTMQLADFANAMQVMYWGMLHTIWAVLPQMRARGRGQIVNITSIGGKVSIPHLLPYSGAKFAAVGLSEGLRAELAQAGIVVTTIIPGLMRTGSHLNATFQGRQGAEYTWFSLAASLPLLSMSAPHAARQIVEATARGAALRILSLPAQLLATVHDLFPQITAEILAFIARMVLPNAPSTKSGARRGQAVQAAFSPRRARLHKALTLLGQKAALRLNQYAPSREVVSKQQD